MAEDFLQQGGGLGGGVFADFLFFFAELVEEAIQRFSDNVFVEIELAGEHAAGGGLLHDAVVLLDYADFFHGVMDYGGEGGGEVGGGGAFEVVGGSGVIAGEDFAGVVEGHFL